MAHQQRNTRTKSGKTQFGQSKQTGKQPNKPASKTPSLFGGNIARINTDIKNPDEEYVMVIARYIGDVPATGQAPAMGELANEDQVPVGIFLPKGTLTKGENGVPFGVGDLITWVGTDLYEGNRPIQNDDGSETVVWKVENFNTEYGVHLWSRKRVRFEAKQPLKQAPTGLMTRMAEMTKALAGFIGK